MYGGCWNLKTLKVCKCGNLKFNTGGTVNEVHQVHQNVSVPLPLLIFSGYLIGYMILLPAEIVFCNL